jgi:DNA-binding NarL/FixJ family response regulator
VTPPRVVVADADELTRAGVRRALAEAGFAVVAEVGDSDAAVTAVERTAPDVAVVAVDLPGGHLEAARRIGARHPGVRLVVLTPRPDGDELLEAVLAGASGYLGADMDAERLPHVLRGVLRGEVALPRRHTERILDELRRRRAHRDALSAVGGSPLSDREWEVLELLTAMTSTGQVARRLGISEVTGRRHLSSAVGKLGVADRGAAVRLMRERSGR